MTIHFFTNLILSIMRKLKLLLAAVALTLGGVISANAAKTVYLAPGTWDVTDATEYYAIWAWADGVDGQWYVMEDADNDGIYEYTFTNDGITGMQFGRMGSNTLTDATSYGTAEKWNVTGDQTVVNGYLYTISGEVSSPTVTTSFFVGTAASFTDGGKYLFKNVATGRYLGPGNSWGTRASLVVPSQYNTINAANGKYTITTHVGNGNFGTNLFMDSSDSPLELAISQVDNGNYIMSTGNKLLGYDGSSYSISGDLIDFTSTNAQWQIIGYDEALAAATEDNPVDASFVILDATFDRNNKHVTKVGNNNWTGVWTVNSSNYNLGGGADENFVAESWRAAFTLSQTITVPNGVYKVRAQAAVTEYDVTGTDLPVVYGSSSNEATVPFKVCTNGNTGMNQFSTNFTNGEFFTEWTDKVLVTNGQITVGVKGTRTNTWCVWDNIQLMYYGVDLTALKEAYSAALATALAYEGNLFDEDWATLNSVITANTLDLNGSLTEEQLNTATSNLEAANAVAAAAALKYSTYTGANGLINGGENVDLTSLIVNPSFENNFTGWTNNGNMAIQGNDAFGKEGSVYAESYQPNGTKGVSQTVGSLPAGIYKMTVTVRARGVTSAKVFAGGIDQAVTIVDADNEYTVNFALDDKSDALIGFEGVGTGAGSSWVALDNFRLTYVGALPDALTAVEGKMNAEVAAAQTTALETYLAAKTVANYNAAEAAIAAAQASVNAYLPLGDAITKIDAALTAATTATASDADYQAVKTAYNDGTIADADILTQIKAAYNAVIPVIKSQTAESADFTLAIQNPSFEYGDLTGWTIESSSDTGARETSNATYAASGSDGRYLFNTWWKGSPLTQTVENLPNGLYTLTAAVASDGATIYLLANGNHDEGTETGGEYPGKDVLQEATFTFTVEDGTATIGVVGGADGTAGEHKDYVEEGYWWYKADNFRLVKVRDLTPVYAVVGSNKDDETDQAIFSGAWDANETTDIMTEESEGVYTLTFANKELDAQTIAYKVIMKQDIESTNATWYPGDGEANKEISIPVKGRYNINFTFTVEGSVVEGVATKTAEAVTIGEKGWATTVTNSALNFSGAEVEAYTAKVVDSKVELTKVDDVQAETGLVLKGAKGTYYLPVIEGSETEKGDLLHSSIYDYDITDDELSSYTFYGLTVNSENKAQFVKLNKGTIPAQKAFLKVANTTAREMSVFFADDTTGINVIAAENGAEGIFNLNGQKVQKAQKGLYIVNGKKVMVK